MIRIKLLFVAVGVALLVPLVLLIDRAIDSVLAERDSHHRVVASRVFDEMENELSDLLNREEGRPFGHYRYEFVEPRAQWQQGQAAPRNVSPLAELPRYPYVLGYFELDPQGRLSTPLKPVRPTSTWRATPVINQRISELTEVVTTRWRSSNKNERAASNNEANQELRLLDNLTPGTTRQVERSKEKELVVQPAYDLKSSLSSLNRGVNKRASRSVTVEKTRAFNTQSQAVGEPPFERGDKSVDVVDVGLEPMVGALLDAQHFLLYRTVWTDNRAYRQGLVLSVPQLAAWLVDATVTGTPLARDAVVDLGPSPDLQGDAFGYSFTHRFAEPFSELGAVMTLSALPDAASPAYVYGLAVMLIFVATLGLLALYRMVSVVVRYAQRRTDFVSAVTHELKTPLTSIRMYGEMLQEGMVPNDEKRDEYYRNITAETERLSRLINNVLELSNIEKGQHEVSLTVGPVGDVVQDVARILGPQAELEGFSLRVEVAPDLPSARYDRDALLQVVFNLVDNALKYARKCENKTIVLSVTQADRGLEIRVRDHGPGVSARHLKKIFEPFYRGQNELTRTAKGTGIGLALVRGLVKRMHGQVSGKNLPDGGFEVTVALPAAG